MMSTPASRPLATAAAVLCLLLAPAALRRWDVPVAGTSPQTFEPDHLHGSASETIGYRASVVSAELRGVVTLETGMTFGGTEVGGLSGLAYDASRDLYYALSDDGSIRNAARFYRVVADTSDGNLDPGDVRVTGVVTLTDDAAQAFAPGSLDPEAIALVDDESIFVASEGDGQGVAPFVRSFSLTGRQRDEIPLPDAFLPDGTGRRGVRGNLALESLVVSADGGTLHTGTESALLQDGPTSSLESGSLSRILTFDLERWAARSQQAYPVAGIPAAPQPPNGLAQNGLVELAALDDSGSLLALERAAVAGRGFTSRLFEIRTSGELDVSSREALADATSGLPLMLAPAPVKRLVADIGSLGVVPDNLEGMAIGPVLPDGKRFVLLVSDDNFNSVQRTQFVGLGLTLANVPVVSASAEGPPLQTTMPYGAPAIWHDPDATGETRLIAARGSSGLAQLDLQGRFLAAVPASSAPSAVALVPRFFQGDPDTALVITAGRAPDLRFQVTSRVPPDFHAVTDPDIATVPFPDGLGSDGLGPVAAFTLPGLGPQALVAEAHGHRLAQVGLRLSGSGGVYGEVLRTLEIPVERTPGSQAVVVGVATGDDGTGYAAVAGEGIYSFRLDPSEPGVVAKTYDVAAVGGDVGGLAWFTAPATGPMILVSRPGDGSLVLLDPSGLRGTFGVFEVGPALDVDGAERPIGVSAMGGDLGATAREGVLVVVDAMDDPQDVVEVEGQLVNRAWNVKLAPWSPALLPTPETRDTPTPRTWRLFVPDARRGP